MVEFTAQIPRNYIEKKQILYTYYIELTSKNDLNNVVKIYEQQFKCNKYIRQLNVDINTQANNYGKNEGNANLLNKSHVANLTNQIHTVQTLVHQFDGLILFRNELRYSSLDNLKELKFKNLLNERPIINLSDLKPEIVYNTQIRFFENLQRLYDCLCTNDETYKNAFSEVKLFLCIRLNFFIYRSNLDCRFNCFQSITNDFKKIRTR
jgi:hypothetical protein